MAWKVENSRWQWYPIRRPTRYYRVIGDSAVVRNRCGHWEDRYFDEPAWTPVPGSGWSKKPDGSFEFLTSISKAQAEKKLKIKL